MSNPFIYGNPVKPENFIGRQSEVNHIIGRILNQGQSTAVIGEPRLGKTSLLKYLTEGDIPKLYGPAHEQTKFNFLDAQALGAEVDQAQFWAKVFAPVSELVETDLVEDIEKAYNLCQTQNFKISAVEALVIQLKKAHWQLVVAVDEFDALLYHPRLNNTDFFGSLRSIASRYGEALVLLIASRQRLEQLNEATQTFSRAGSPYFNFLGEITLGPLEDIEVAQLLGRETHYFKDYDRRFIARISGAHPYLLQLTASELWEAYQRTDKAKAQDEQIRERWARAGNELHAEAKMILRDTWRGWSAAHQRAFIAVGIPHLSEMLGVHNFDSNALQRDLGDVETELRELEKQGFVQEVTPNHWCVRPLAFLLPLSEELRQLVRKEQSPEDWLKEQEFAFGHLKQGQIQALEKAAKALGPLLQEGATGVMKAIIGSLLGGG